MTTGSEPAHPPPGCFYISHNVDGLAAALSDPRRLALLKTFAILRPMFLLIQETKAQTSRAHRLEAALSELFPYLEFYWNCSTKKLGYAGTLTGVHKSLPYTVSAVQIGSGDLMLSQADSEGRIQLIRPTDGFPGPSIVNLYDVNAKWQLQRLHEKLSMWSPAFGTFLRGVPGPLLLIGDLNARLSTGPESLHPSFLHEAEATPSLTTKEADAMISILHSRNMARQRVEASTNGSPHTFYPSDYERGQKMGMAIDYCATDDVGCLLPFLTKLDPVSPALKFQSVTVPNDTDGIPVTNITGPRLLLWGRRRDHQALICVAEGARKIRAVEPDHEEEFKQERRPGPFSRLQVPDS